MRRGQFVVVETAHILHMNEFEDVMHAQGELHVGLLGVEEVAALGQVHEDGTARILLEIGVVLIAELAPEHTEAYPLTPLELADERDAVEELTVEVPVELGREEAVCGELHVVDGLEGVVLYDIGEVGLGHDEQRVRYLLPLDAALEEPVHLSP